MPKIFISYRKEDSKYATLRIYEELINHFGSESVVFDIDTIPLGTDFRDYLDKVVSKCDILLAVIGDQWIEILKQRLDKPNDFVRIEIQAALERQIPVVLVLVGKSLVPSEKNLPQELAGLAYKIAAEVRAGPDLQNHLKRLIGGLDRLLAERKAEEERRRKAEENLKRKEVETKHKAEDERKCKEAEEKRKRQATEKPYISEKDRTIIRPRSPVSGRKYDSDDREFADIFSLPQKSKWQIHQENVWIAAASPEVVSPNSFFVARFAAYTSKYREMVTATIETESPKSKLFLDLHACQWEPGTKVTVCLTANELIVESSMQSFAWNGKWVVLRFDVSVPEFPTNTNIVMRFDVYIEGLIIARLRPELKITTDSSCFDSQQIQTELEAPKKAFASYSSRDQREVVGRIRSLQIFTGIDVFLDCLSIKPGEKWKDKIRSEIFQRDIFWLFWSRNAMESSWVEWEWRTALDEKTIHGIQPHPLEPSDIAPPPAELAVLQFGTLYESYLNQLKSDWLNRSIVLVRRFLRIAPGQFFSLFVVLFLFLLKFLRIAVRLFFRLFVILFIFLFVLVGLLRIVSYFFY